eukprot:6039438-Amphidinium_carterae.1
MAVLGVLRPFGSIVHERSAKVPVGPGPAGRLLGGAALGAFSPLGAPNPSFALGRPPSLGPPP